MMRTIAFTLIISSLLLLPNCTNRHKSTTEKTVFRYNEPTGISSLDPAYSRDKARIWACNQLFNGLIELSDSLTVKPSIAKEWKITDNGRTYTFKLRNDVHFHNDPCFKSNKGRIVSSHDFVYSFNRILDSKVASPGAWVFQNVEMVDNKYQFLAPNDTTLIIKLKEPFSPFLSLLGMQYCSVVPHEAIEYYGLDFRAHPVGTGPFMFKLWKEDTKLVFVRNPNYFEATASNPLPYLDAVSVTFIVDRQSAFLEFVKGKLDFLSGIDASYKDELLTHKGTLQPKYLDRLNLETQPYLNTEYLGILVDSTKGSQINKALLNKKIRQAINYGFDREKMMTYLRNNIGIPATKGMIPYGMPGFNTGCNYGYTYNPEKAKQLLKEAGYEGGEGLSPITISTNKEYVDLCNYIQHQLGEIGIKVNIDVMPSATLRENMAKGKVEFFRGSWIADYPDAENYLSLFYSKNKAPSGPNYTHFSNEYFDHVYETARIETDEIKKLTLYRILDSMIMEEAVVVPLYYDQVLRFTHKNISGAQGNPMNLLKLKSVKKTPIKQVK